MLATRPAPAAVGTLSAETGSSSQEEKSVPGVKEDVLREERQPLLDLDDVEQLESELAACFDAPPPPPLNTRRERPAPSVAPWPPAAAAASSNGHLYINNGDEIRFPPTSSQLAMSSVATIAERRPNHRIEEEPQEGHGQEEALEQRQGREEAKLSEKQQQEKAPMDLSSLYSPQRTVSSRQLYPALLPSAPSAQSLRPESLEQQPAAPPVSDGLAPTAPSTENFLRSENVKQAHAVVEPSPTVQAASAAVTAMRDANREASAMGSTAGTNTKGLNESSVQVVDDLLSENATLRLILQDVLSELDRVKSEVESTAIDASSSQQTISTSQRLWGSWGSASAPEPAAQPNTTSTLDQYPGAAAEANRLHSEERQPQRSQTRQEEYVHFKCENCPQWLKIPNHAQLIYCPTCSHTSQYTSSSTVHHLDGRNANGRAGEAASSGNNEEDIGFVDFIKKIFV